MLRLGVEIVLIVERPLGSLEAGTKTVFILEVR
jgi:hypothetical protein